MNERAQTGLLACLITCLLCGVPGILFLWKSLPATAPQQVLSPTPQRSAIVPIPLAQVNAPLSPPATTNQELRIEEDPVTGKNKYIGPWTREQIEDAEFAARQGRADAAMINRRSQLQEQENMLNRVFNRRR